MRSEELEERVEKLLAAPILTVTAGAEGSSDRRRHPPGHPDAVRDQPRWSPPGGTGHAPAWCPPGRPGSGPGHRRGARTGLSNASMDRARRRTVRAAPRERARDRCRRDTAREEGSPSCPRRKSARPRRVPPGATGGSSTSAPDGAAGRRPAGKPKIGDTRPAPAVPPPPPPTAAAPRGRRCPRPEGADAEGGTGPDEAGRRRADRGDDGGDGQARRGSRRRSGRERRTQAGRPLPGLRARPAPHDPDRHARGPLAGRALRVPGGRRHQPDRRQRLPGPGAERAARHGGRLRRHRDPQERRALPGRRALRQGRHRGRGLAAAPDRGRAQGRADDPVPGHQEPDRGQGGPPDPGGLAARALRRAGAQLERLRHLQAPGRQRAAPAAPHHRRGEAGRATA